MFTEDDDPFRTGHEYRAARNSRYLEILTMASIMKSGGSCLICGYSEDPLILEQHHIAGRRNSDVTITVCPNCHRKLSMNQRSWPKEWTSKNNSPETRIPLIVRGAHEISLARANAIKAILLEQQSKNKIERELDHG